MASAQEPGTVRVAVFYPKTGQEHTVLEDRVEWLGPGGSPDGVPASTATPDVLQNIPVSMAPDGGWMYGGCQLRIYFTSDAEDGLDASDAVWKIPITLATGEVINLGNRSEDFNTLAFADQTANDAVEQLLAVHTTPTGRRWAFGGGLIFLSIEDDTA